VTETEAREMENAQKVADDHDAREAQKIAALADEQEAMEAAQRVADEMEAKEEDERRRKTAIARLSARAQGEGYVVSEDQIQVEIAAIRVQEAGEAILVKARGMMQAATDAEIALRMK
jgi:hypothetical protein